MSVFRKLSILALVASLVFMASMVSSKSEAAQATPAATASSEDRPDFEQYFRPFNVIGSFELYDLNADHYLCYNPDRTTKAFIPASTFKIFNSLVGLETGVLTDKNFVIKWDGTQYPYEGWNQDQTMQHAFQYSVVWYYQEVARRVGRERMQHWIDAAHYGNQDISGNIDSFWLDGKLRISQDQEIDLLVRLYKGTLPFSQRSMDIVKKIMVVEKTGTFTLRGKTGLGNRVTPQIGWYVGYLETQGDVYFFATNIESAHPDENFSGARITITRQILQSLKLLPGG